MKIDRVLLQQSVVAPIEPHRHDLFEAHYLGTGRGTYLTDGKRIGVRGGQFLLTFPGDLHALGPLPDAPPLTQYIVFFRAEKRDAPLVSSLRKLLGPRRCTDLGGPQILRFERIRRLHDLAHPLARRAFSLQFESFLHEIVLDRAAGAAIAPESSLVSRALRHFQERVIERVRIRDLARSLEVSPQHLIRQFRLQVGVPPLRYLLDLKIEYAKELLAERPRTNRELADLLGFSHEFHFSRTFRRATGTSPSRFKERIPPPRKS